MDSAVMHEDGPRGNTVVVPTTSGLTPQDLQQVEHMAARGQATLTELAELTVEARRLQNLLQLREVRLKAIVEGLRAADLQLPEAEVAEVQSTLEALWAQAQSRDRQAWADLEQRRHQCLVTAKTFMAALDSLEALHWHRGWTARDDPSSWQVVCPVCLSAAVTRVLRPCGHLVCSTCSVQCLGHRCGECRRRVEEVCPVFLPCVSRLTTAAHDHLDDDSPAARGPPAQHPAQLPHPPHADRRDRPGDDGPDDNMAASGPASGAGSLDSVIMASMIASLMRTLDRRRPDAHASSSRSRLPHDHGGGGGGSSSGMAVADRGGLGAPDTTRAGLLLGADTPARGDHRVAISVHTIPVPASAMAAATRGGGSSSDALVRHLLQRAAMAANESPPADDDAHPVGGHSE